MGTGCVEEGGYLDRSEGHAMENGEPLVIEVSVEAELQPDLRSRGPAVPRSGMGWGVVLWVTNSQAPLGFGSSGEDGR